MRDLQIGETVEYVKRLNPARGDALDVYERTARIAKHVADRVIAKYDSRRHTITTSIELHNCAPDVAAAARVRITVSRER